MQSVGKSAANYVDFGSMHFPSDYAKKKLKINGFKIVFYVYLKIICNQIRAKNPQQIHEQYATEIDMLCS